MRSCRLLRRVSSSLGSSLQQAQVAAAACTAAAQASTSCAVAEPCCSSYSIPFQLSFKHYSTLTGTPQARILEVTTALNSYPPVTLQFDRGQVHIPPDLDTPWGRTLLRMMGFFSKSSQLLHGAQRLYEAVSEQIDSGVLQKAFQTGRVFWSSYVLLSLHVWMVIHRLRGSASPDVKVLRQRFYNAFQQDVEFRVYASGLQVGVTKWLKKLEMHFYETGYALDKVLAGQSEDSLETVLLRAFYGGGEAQRPNAQLLAAYVTRELQCLELTPEEAIFAGHVRFSGVLKGAVERAGVTSPGGEPGAGGAGGGGCGGGETGAEAGLMGPGAVEGAKGT